MDVSLDAIVGELNLVEGVHQPNPLHIAAHTPPRRAKQDRRDETLFVFLDLGPTSPTQLAQAMIEKITKNYWRQSGGITMALRRAIQASNAYLLEYNRSFPVGQRQHGGVICAVLRQAGLYLAQTGPARGVWRSDGQTHHFPERPMPSQNKSPLGVTQGIDIRYTRTRVANGDMVALTGDVWGKHLPGERLAAALNLTSAQTVIKALESQLEHTSASALIIECAHAQKEIQDSFTTKDADHVAQGIAHHPQNGALVEETETPSRFSTLSDVDWTPHIHKARDTAKNVGAALGDGARALLERVLPEPEPTPPHQQGRHNRRAISENTTRMIGIAIAIPLIVVFIVAVLYMRQSDTAGQQDIFKQARRAYQTAQSAANSAADPETTRALWQTAFLELNQAKSSDPDNKEIAEMYGKAQAALDALDNVQRPPLSLLWNYGAGGDHSIAASRITVYVLDSEANQVLRHDLNESRDGTLGRDPSRIAYKEQAVGEKPIGEPAYLVWLGAGGARTQDALFILTTDDELLEYDQSWGLKRLTFDTGLMPISVRVLDAFDGKLYILDPVYSQIWRFPAAGDVFGPPEGYFAASAPDLGQAVDMTIDGAIYVLLQDQRILKFWGGQAQPFEIIGLPRPLVRPVALAVEGDQQNGALYVADAGSQCIIVLDKNGHFISQLCAEQNLLENLESLAIDQDNRVLYMIANGRLYSLSLPTLPLPEEPESP